MTRPRQIAAATERYAGNRTTPERWQTWTPRQGDIIVCTPPKSGTTWTQTILALLLNGGRDLPQPMNTLSPWVDSNFGEADAVARSLQAQTGRRIIKTHTPADGFPAWEGVTTIAVYRHPLDVFLSLRNHISNMTGTDGHPMRWPLEKAAERFLTLPPDTQDFDTDCLGLVVLHYRRSLDRLAQAGFAMMHYADMLADRRAAVARLADCAGIDATPQLIETVAAETGLSAMRGKASAYVPGGGTGLWGDESAFFHRGRSGEWQETLGADILALYRSQIEKLLPDPAERRWLEYGNT